MRDTLPEQPADGPGREKPGETPGEREDSGSPENVPPPEKKRSPLRKAGFLLFLLVEGVVLLGLAALGAEAYFPGLIPTGWLDSREDAQEAEAPAPPPGNGPANGEPASGEGPEKGPSRSRPDLVQLEGRVFYAGGDPAPGATVWCRHQLGDNPAPNAPWENLRTATVDARGSFRLENLPSKELKILVFDRNDVVERRLEAVGPEGAKPLEFEFGRKSRLCGSVTDAGGNPVAEVRIRLIILGRNLNAFPKGFQTEIVAASDAGGKFSLDGVPPGKATLKVSKAGFVGRTVAGIDVEEESRKDLDIVLELSAMVEGVVRLGEAVPVARSGLEIRVHFIDREDGFVMTQTRKVTAVAPDGRYACEIESFDEKTVLSARASGFRPVWVPFEVKRGERRTIDLHLVEKGGVLKGRIVPPGRKPIRIKAIRIIKEYGSDEEEYGDDRIWDPLELEPDREGRFACDCLDICPYRLSVHVILPGGRTWGTEKVFTPDLTDLVVEVPE